MQIYDSSELFFKCTVTSPATTCLVISLKNLDSCKTLIACEFSFVVLLCWFLLHTALELYWIVILLHRILNNNNLVGEIPAQLANCFSLITLYVFCANFVLTAWLVNSPALKHVLFFGVPDTYLIKLWLPMDDIKKGWAILFFCNYRALGPRGLTTQGSYNVVLLPKKLPYYGLVLKIDNTRASEHTWNELA